MILYGNYFNNLVRGSRLTLNKTGTLPVYIQCFRWVPPIDYRRYPIPDTRYAGSAR